MSCHFYNIVVPDGLQHNFIYKKNCRIFEKIFITCAVFFYKIKNP